MEMSTGVSLLKNRQVSLNWSDYSIVFVNYRTIVSLDNPSMAFMITKLFTTHVVEYVQILSKLPVVFSAAETEKNKIKFVHVFGSAFGFGSVSVSAHM